MGTWNVGINTNDTAQDLKSEYQVAFYRYEPIIAVQKLDAYVQWSFVPLDAPTWCDYVYSLADYMWTYRMTANSIARAACTISKSGTITSLETIRKIYRPSPTVTVSSSASTAPSATLIRTC